MFYMLAGAIWRIVNLTKEVCIAILYCIFEYTLILLAGRAYLKARKNLQGGLNEDSR